MEVVIISIMIQRHLNKGGYSPVAHIFNTGSCLLGHCFLSIFWKIHQVLKLKLNFKLSVVKSEGL